MGVNRVIGVHGTLPWWVPEEYSHFLSCITDQTVIMGRKTFEIFSKDLPSKRNLVISRQNKVYERALVFVSLEEAIEEAERYPEDIYFAGGATIYEKALGIADRMYLSIIKGNFDGDTFFPPFEHAGWELRSRQQCSGFELLKYKKKHL